MRPDEQPTAERLDRFWDALVTGAPAPNDADADPEITVRWLHAADVPPRPRPRFVDRLEETLMDRPAATTQPLAPPMNGAGAPLLPRANGRPALVPRRVRRFNAAPAAVFVLALVVAIAALGASWGRIGWLHSSNPSVPAAFPAGQAVATPQPVAMDGGDAGRSGVAPGSGPIGAPSIAWSLIMAGPGGPIIAGDRVYYTSIVNETSWLLVAADLTTGATLWSAPVAMPIFNPTPSVAGGRVYLPAPQALNAYDAETGAPLWSYAAGAPLNAASATVAEGLVYVTARDMTLRAVDAATGVERWRAEIPAGAGADQSMLASVAQPVAADGQVYSAGNGGLLVAHDARDGQLRWTFQTTGDMIPTPPRAVDGVVIVSVENAQPGADGARRWTQAIDAATGTLRWQIAGDDAGAVAAMLDGVVYLMNAGAERTRLAAVRLDDGAPIWSYETSALAYSVVVANGVLYVASEDGVVDGVDLVTRQPVFRVNLGAVFNLAAGEELIVATTLDGLLAVNGSPAGGTPTTGAAPTDLSGLPACTAPRAAPADVAAGTPAATLDAETMIVGAPVPGNSAQILTGNVPTGPAAPAPAIAGIQQTLDALIDCTVGRTSESVKIDGFFTDDFFRRGWSGGAELHPSYPTPPLSLLPAAAIIQTVALDDGRIAVTVQEVDAPGARPLLLIFTMVDGVWLIDERYQVVTEYAGPQG